MTALTNALHLAPPLGVPPEGIDVATYYQNLKQAMTVSVANEETVGIWIEDDDQFTTLFAMTKGALRFIPQGTQGPKNAPVAGDTLVLKIWIWDYLNLRKSIAPGKRLPKLITYSNVDQVKVRTAIQQEVDANQRYTTATAAEKITIVDAFMNDGSRLLVSAGTPIGSGLQEPPNAPLPGTRRVDIEFVHRDGTVESPNEVFEVWRITLGPAIEKHPLFESLSGPVVPAVAPIEGGLRVRIAGANLLAGTVAALDSVALADLKISADGQSMYGTLPPAAEGEHTLVLKSSSGGSDIVIGPVTYVTDIAATARAVVAAHSVRLQEIRDAVAHLKTTGGLDNHMRTRVDGWISELQWVPSGQIADRSMGGGGSVYDPSVDDAWLGNAERLRSIEDEIQVLLEE